MRKNIDKKLMLHYFKANSLSLNKLLNSLFNNKIIRMTYLGISKMKKIPEYNFSLLKFNVVLEDYSNYIIYIKLIEEGQIAESLYCYWLFCEENYNYNTKLYSVGSNYITDIKNYKRKCYEKMYELKIVNNRNNIWNSSFVDVININQYKKKNLKNNNKWEKQKQYLFVGVL